MKNKIITLTLSLMLSTVASANCLSAYEASLKSPKIKTTIMDQFSKGGATNDKAGGTLLYMAQTGSILTGWATLGFFPGAVGGMLIIPAAVFTSVGIENLVVGISNIKEEKMISLINESYQYNSNQGVPGRFLKKLHKSLSRSGVSVSYQDLAKTIIENNENENLCLESEMSFQEVKRALKDGELSIVDIDRN